MARAKHLSPSDGGDKRPSEQKGNAALDIIPQQRIQTNRCKCSLTTFDAGAAGTATTGAAGAAGTATTGEAEAAGITTTGGAGEAGTTGGTGEVLRSVPAAARFPRFASPKTRPPRALGGMGAVAPANEDDAGVGAPLAGGNT